MSGPTEFHGRMLVDTIEQIDAFILRAFSEGGVPVLDAVEVAKLLRALVSGAPRYTIDAETLHKRFARMKASVENPVVAVHTMAPAIAWKPAAEKEGAW